MFRNEDRFYLICSQSEVIVAHFQRNKTILVLSKDPDIARQSISTDCNRFTRNGVFEVRSEVGSFLHRNHEIVIVADDVCGSGQLSLNESLKRYLLIFFLSESPNHDSLKRRNSPLNSEVLTGCSVVKLNLKGAMTVVSLILFIDDVNYIISSLKIVQSVNQELLIDLSDSVVGCLVGSVIVDCSP